jgi:hypothetical protein
MKGSFYEVSPINDPQSNRNAITDVHSNSRLIKGQSAVKPLDQTVLTILVAAANATLLPRLGKAKMKLKK